MKAAMAMLLALAVSAGAVTVNLSNDTVYVKTPATDLEAANKAYVDAGGGSYTPPSATVSNSGAYFVASAGAGAVTGVVALTAIGASVQAFDADLSRLATLDSGALTNANLTAAGQVTIHKTAATTIVSNQTALLADGGVVATGMQNFGGQPITNTSLVIVGSNEDNLTVLRSDTGSGLSLFKTDGSYQSLYGIASVTASGAVTSITGFGLDGTLNSWDSDSLTVYGGNNAPGASIYAHDDIFSESNVTARGFTVGAVPSTTNGTSLASTDGADLFVGGLHVGTFAALSNTVKSVADSQGYGGGGSGDLTAVLAGYGATVTSSTGPVPTIAVSNAVVDRALMAITNVTAGSGVGATTNGGTITLTASGGAAAGAWTQLWATTLVASVPSVEVGSTAWDYDEFRISGHIKGDRPTAGGLETLGVFVNGDYAANYDSVGFRSTDGGAWTITDEAGTAGMRIFCLSVGYPSAPDAYSRFEYDISGGAGVRAAYKATTDGSMTNAIQLIVRAGGAWRSSANITSLTVDVLGALGTNIWTGSRIVFEAR